MKKHLFSLLIFLSFSACKKQELAPFENNPEHIHDIDFRGPDEAIALIDNLIAQVTQLISEGALNRGQGQSISSILEGIKRKLQQGKPEVALSKLNALKNKMEGLARGGSIEPDIIDELLANLESIECETNPVDNDGDGFLCNEDCNDEDPQQFPGNTELCDDGIDNDCDGLVDTSDPDCFGCDNDVESPKIICVFGFEAEIGPEGTVFLFASDFVSSVSDNCTANADLILSFSEDGTQPGKLFTCNDIPPGGDPIPTAIWVIDEAGNSDFCILPLTLTDGGGFCP